VIVACGTSYHAGLVGRYAIEEWARLPVEMDIASEYRYRNPVVLLADGIIGQMVEPVCLPAPQPPRPIPPWAVTGEAAARTNLITSIHLEPDSQEAHERHLQDKYALAEREDLVGLTPGERPRPPRGAAAPPRRAVGKRPQHEPAHRRRLLDVVLSQISPAYFFLLLRYARAVEQRNRLLRDLAGAAIRERETALEPWDEQLSTMGAAITARRVAMVRRLSQAAREGYAYLASDREALTIAYAPSLPPGDETAMIVAARDAFARRRRDELIRGTTLTGPHRDDLRMQIDGYDLRTFGSRGQHQAAMLALRLAERKVLLEESGEEPVLLLDDAAQLLDEERQMRLMQLVERAQTLLTLTTTATLRRIPTETAVFKVAGCHVEPEHAHAT